MPILHKDRAQEIIRGFEGRKILVVGDVMLDRYVFGKVERLNPEAPVPILHATSEKCQTGGAGNVAKNAAALGARTVLISVVGNDTAANQLEQAARAEGYEPRFLRGANRRTIEKRRYIVHSQQMLRVDHEEIEDVSGDLEQTLIEQIATAATDAEAIIVSDYAKGVLTTPVCRAILAAGRERSIPVMADIKPSHINDFVGATYISPNRKEAHEYLGLNQHLKGGYRAEEIAEQLRERFQTNVFMTLSEDGIYVLAREAREGFRVPQIQRIEVADTSGCGDTAAVAIVLAKLAGATDREAAHIANAAGGVIATKIGAVALGRDELLEALLKQHENQAGECQESDLSRS